MISQPIQQVIEDLDGREADLQSFARITDTLDRRALLRDFIGERSNDGWATKWLRLPIATFDRFEAAATELTNHDAGSRAYCTGMVG